VATVSKPTYSGHQNFLGSYNPQGHGSGRPSSAVKRCFECNGIRHFARECPALSRGYNHPGHAPYNRWNYRSSALGARKASEGNWRSANARVNTCSVAGSPELYKREIGTQCENDEQSVNFVEQNEWEFGQFPSVNAVSTKQPVSFCVYPLQYVDVFVDGQACVALKDSGCQIPIVNSKLFGWCCDGAIGKVELRGFGREHTVEAPLVSLPIKLCSQDGDDAKLQEMPIVCAVTELGTGDCDVNLPAEVVYELQAPVISIQASDVSVSAVSDETTRQDEDVDVDQCVTNVVDACSSDVGV